MIVARRILDGGTGVWSFATQTTGSFTKIFCLSIGIQLTSELLSWLFFELFYCQSFRFSRLCAPRLQIGLQIAPTYSATSPWMHFCSNSFFNILVSPGVLFSPPPLPANLGCFCCRNLTVEAELWPFLLDSSNLYGFVWTFLPYWIQIDSG